MWWKGVDDRVNSVLVERHGSPWLKGMVPLDGKGRSLAVERDGLLWWKG